MVRQGRRARAQSCSDSCEIVFFFTVAAGRRRSLLLHRVSAQSCDCEQRSSATRPAEKGTRGWHRENERKAEKGKLLAPWKRSERQRQKSCGAPTLCPPSASGPWAPPHLHRTNK